MRQLNRNPSAPRLASRTQGISLLELVVSVSLFIGISLAAHASLLRGLQQQEGSQSEYLAFVFLRDAIAEVQDIANRDYDAGQQEGLPFVWQRYDSATRSLGGLESGTLVTQVFANETSIPTELGGSQDLNFDGDSSDDLDNLIGGSDLKIVPMAFTLSYEEAGTPRSITLYRLVTRTTD